VCVLFPLSWGGFIFLAWQSHFHWYIYHLFFLSNYDFELTFYFLSALSLKSNLRYKLCLNFLNNQEKWTLWNVFQCYLYTLCLFPKQKWYLSWFMRLSLVSAFLFYSGWKLNYGRGTSCAMPDTYNKSLSLGVSSLQINHLTSDSMLTYQLIIIESSVNLYILEILKVRWPETNFGLWKINYWKKYQYFKILAFF